MPNSLSCASLDAVVVSRNASVKSSVDGFISALPERPPNFARQRLRRSSSVPHLPSFAENFNNSTPPPRPSKFLSASHSISSVKTYNPRPYFRSRRIKKGTVDRPELKEKDPRAIWITLIPIFGFLIGCGAIAALTWNGYASVSNHQYCTVFIDDFSNGFNSTIWTKQVETGGFG